MEKNKNDFDELRIFNDSVNNLNISKDVYRYIYTTIGFNFCNYLKSLPDHMIQKIEDDLKINFYSFIDLKNEPNFEEIFHILNQFLL